LCNLFAGQGYDKATQLQLTEQQMKRERPDLFGAAPNRQPAKPAAQVHTPGGRAPRQNSGPKGFADMPPESQKVANDMAERLGGDDPKAFKERFAKNYWQNAEGKR
jgi:hypothetical protein